jgi:cyclopropane-fatty-acyl-phospholipid synthase
LTESELTTTEPTEQGAGATGIDVGAARLDRFPAGRAGSTPLEDRAAGNDNVAALLLPMMATLIGPPPVRISFWDHSVLGPTDSAGGVHVRSANALRRMVWAPGELGLGRAFVAGELDFEGDLFELIDGLRPAGLKLARHLLAVPAILKAAYRLRLIGWPMPPPAEEARPRGWRHSKRRDAASISHHYDVSNDFYRLVLGDTMTYSCARFADPGDGLDDAQSAKHELICRKLGLHERSGMRLLDVGCGWGSMALHAARHHGARVVGITISREQADYARKRVFKAGLDDLVEIRLQDYRELGGERFDAISSIGMFEHVGQRRMAVYFSTLRSLLGPRGRMVNHAISSVGGSKLGRRSFTHRYVFPDGELIDVGHVALAMEDAGFEVRDVESLREHYGRTLRHWVANLQRHWADAVDLVGEGKARVWLLYMAASAIGFEHGGLAIHQVLGVVPDSTGRSGMPATRRDWA